MIITINGKNVNVPRLNKETFIIHYMSDLSRLYGNVISKVSAKGMQLAINHLDNADFPSELCCEDVFKYSAKTLRFTAPITQEEVDQITAEYTAYVRKINKAETLSQNLIDDGIALQTKLTELKDQLNGWAFRRTGSRTGGVWNTLKSSVLLNRQDEYLAANHLV